MEQWQQWLMQYGCPLIVLLLAAGIVGLPVPDETLLTTVGVMIFYGQLPAVWAVASCVVGSMCGITLSYLIGRGPGWAAAHRWGPRLPLLRLTPERIEQIHRWFARYGKWTLTFGYFLPGVRHFTAIVAGTSRLGYWSFAAFAYTGALIWSSTFLLLGYLLGRAMGDNWKTVAHSMHHGLTIAAAALVVAVVVVLLVRRRRS